MTTTRKATTRATTIAPSPSGSPKTTTPAAIDVAFPTIEVTAITGTVCSTHATAAAACHVR